MSTGPCCDSVCGKGTDDASSSPASDTGACHFRSGTCRRVLRDAQETHAEYSPTVPLATAKGHDCY